MSQCKHGDKPRAYTRITRRLDDLKSQQGWWADSSDERPPNSHETIDNLQAELRAGTIAMTLMIDTLDEQKEAISKLQAKVESVAAAAYRGIEHVGRANYAEREREAIRWVEEAMEVESGK